MTRKHLKVAAIFGIVAIAVVGCTAAYGHKRDKHEEWREDLASTFSQADRDGSGSLDAAEFENWMELRWANRAARMMERMDENGDGQVTVEEMEEGAHHGWRRRWH